jgi:20S proteasome subunit beta 1
MSEEVLTGTTIMAVRIENGVIIGADSRTSMGTYIPNRVTNKLTRLTDLIYCCRSGSAADTRIIADIVSMTLYKYDHGVDVRPTVKRAAAIGRNLIYKYPSLLAGLIIAGYDEIEKGSVYSISLGGSLVESDWAIGGSGSGYIYGYCDQNWRESMSTEEKFNFVKSAISLAIRRDNYSGGCIRMAVVTNEGVREFFVPGNEILPQ